VLVIHSKYIVTLKAFCCDYQHFGVHRSLLTITVQDIHEFRVRTSCEFLSTKCFTDYLMVTKHHDQLVPQPRAKHAAILAGEIIVVKVTDAFHKGQITEDGKSPWSRWKCAIFYQDLNRTNKREHQNEHY